MSEFEFNCLGCGAKCCQEIFKDSQGRELVNMSCDACGWYMGDQIISEPEFGMLPPAEDMPESGT